jgi:hypothetical protein
VAVVFGRWTSDNRKSVVPIFKETDGFLFFRTQMTRQLLAQRMLQALYSRIPEFNS